MLYFFPAEGRLSSCLPRGITQYGGLDGGTLPRTGQQRRRGYRWVCMMNIHEVTAG